MLARWCATSGTEANGLVISRTRDEQREKVEEKTKQRKVKVAEANTNASAKVGAEQVRWRARDEQLSFQF